VLLVCEGSIVSDFLDKKSSFLLVILATSLKLLRVVQFYLYFGIGSGEKGCVTKKKIK